MILMLGDIHGNLAHVQREIENKKINNCTIIQVGDFGIGTTSRDNCDRVLKDLNDFLNLYDITMYVIRGNHDDPFYFKGDHIFSNLKLLPDYTQIEVDGYNILFVGGAVSVDRKVSLSKMQLAASVGIKQNLYWFDEAFVLDENKLKDIKNVNMVVTHTAPEWCFPDNRSGFNDFVLGFSDRDDRLLDDLKHERAIVTKMFKILKENGNNIIKHYYGHFHRSEITLNGYTEHILLGVGEFQMVDQPTEQDYEALFN